jgi:hypothetical protein
MEQVCYPQKASFSRSLNTCDEIPNLGMEIAHLGCCAEPLLGLRMWFMQQA